MWYIPISYLKHIILFLHLQKPKDASLRYSSLSVTNTSFLLLKSPQALQQDYKIITQMCTARYTPKFENKAGYINMILNTWFWDNNQKQHPFGLLPGVQSQVSKPLSNFCFQFQYCLKQTQKTRTFITARFTVHHLRYTQNRQIKSNVFLKFTASSSEQSCQEV